MSATLIMEAAFCNNIKFLTDDEVGFHIMLTRKIKRKMKLDIMSILF